MIEGSLDNFIRGIQESDMAKIQEAWFKLEKNQQSKIKEVLTQMPEDKLKIMEKKIKVFNYQLWKDIFEFGECLDDKTLNNIKNELSEQVENIALNKPVYDSAKIQKSYEQYYKTYIDRKVRILKHYMEQLKLNNFKNNQIKKLLIEESKIIKPHPAKGKR